ncbi:MAG: class I SAM-dependent methyltransferase [Candidatus Hodarchaeota archaeon]
MCNASGIIFGAINLTREEVEGKKVIEVGSQDISGSLRPIVESLNPAEYIGVDIIEGSGVDIIQNAEDLLIKFDKERFDIIIATELIEHVKDWKKVISNFKNICAPNGIILITTRSYGFPYHGYPYDHWRYEIEDMKYIFSDFIIKKLEKDKLASGVFIKAIKPKDFIENDLTNYKLYSIILNMRVKEINEKNINHYLKKYKIYRVLKGIFNRIEKFIFKITRLQ